MTWPVSLHQLLDGGQGPLGRLQQLATRGKRCTGAGHGCMGRKQHSEGVSCTIHINTKTLICPRQCAYCTRYLGTTAVPVTSTAHQDTSATGHQGKAGPPSNTNRINTQFQAVLTDVTPDRSSSNLKKTQMIKQQQQKQHHRTEAKNKIQQHCFSSGLLLCLKRKSLQRAIPALTSDSASQTTHQFPIVHTQLEPRYHSSGDEKQERETVTTLKIPGSEELEGWVLGGR